MLQKNAKSKKFTVSFHGETPLKFKKRPPKKSNNFHPVPAASTTARPLPCYFWPVIAVLQQCADGMATA